MYIYICIHIYIYIYPHLEPLSNGQFLLLGGDLLQLHRLELQTARLLQENTRGAGLELSQLGSMT